MNLIAVIVCVLIIVLLIGAAYMLFKYWRKNTKAPTIAPKHAYYRINDRLETDAPSLDAMQTMQDIFKDYHVAQKGSKINDVDILFFESLNKVDTHLEKLVMPKNIQYCYGIAGTDFLASKSVLCMMIRRVLGRDVESSILPKTWILNNKLDRDRLNTEFEYGQVYIMKKNIQRQQGTHLTTSLHEIQTLANDGEYVVVQQVLQDPYIVNGRKINLRVYLLVVVKPGATPSADFYYYDNGFLYYTPELFEKHTKDPQKLITTGYIDRKVYEENPLTHKDLWKILDSTHVRTMKESVHDVMKCLKDTYSGHFLRMNASATETRFLIYGCDIAPDATGQVKLMEVNKGPDLSYKDERDKAVKYNMVRDAFEIVGLMPSANAQENGFIKV